MLRYGAKFRVLFYVVGLRGILRNEVAVDAHTACEVDVLVAVGAHKFADEFGFIAGCEFA